ncbi:hypothetical protein ACLOJK_034298 [Asimina triloba]
MLIFRSSCCWRVASGDRWLRSNGIEEEADVLVLPSILGLGECRWVAILYKVGFNPSGFGIWAALKDVICCLGPGRLLQMGTPSWCDPAGSRSGAAGELHARSDDRWCGFCRGSRAGLLVVFEIHGWIMLGFG